MAGMARKSRGRSTQARSRGGCLLAGDAQLHGEHAAARHGFGEHGAIAGSPCPAAGHPAGGVCEDFAGRLAPPARRAQSIAGRSDSRFAAAGNSRAKETHFYFALGRMAARTTAKKAGNEFRGSCAASRASLAPRRDRRRLEGFPRGENHLVASLVSLRSERVVPPASRRMNLALRYTDSHRAMNILGINAYHGNASAAIVCDGRLVAAVEEERFNRVKYAAGFPAQAIHYCLKKAGLTLAEIDHVAVPRNPYARLGRKIFYALRMPSFARG